ncbi:MAG: hypothetical protein EPN21_12070 [Methylococcaceae bacterium]|nr:MAG: hypothetical protein EPN21_12070 [Methylococcaceae bacterium]
MAIGIDFDGNSAAWVRLRRGNDKPVLEAKSTFALVPSREIATMTGVFSRNNQGVPCVLVLEREDYNLIQTPAPEVDEADLRDAVLWKIKDELGFSVQDVVLDVFDFPLGKNQQGRRLYVAAASANKVQRKVEWLLGGDAALCAIDIPEQVIRNVVSLLPENETGVALLFLMEQESVILLCRQGMLHLSRSIPIGYERLRRGFAGIDPDAPLDSLPHDAQALLDRVTLEVQRTLDFYDSNYSYDGHITLFTTTALAALPGAIEYFGLSLGLTPKIMDLNELFYCEEALSVEEQITYLRALGAALRQFLV